MGVAVGLVLIAFGAILTWAVDATVSGLNVTAIGVILLVLGIVVVLLDFFWWRSWEWVTPGPGGPAMRRRTYVRDTAVAPVAGQPVQPVQPVAPAPRRRVVEVEEDAGPYPGAPPPP
jgi:hypothetical protein